MGNTNKNWMHSVDDSTLISDLSIPGTHNSGAEYYSPLNPVSIIARCQSTYIDEQLENGVRFLDIRCVVEDEILKVYHGKVNEHLSFEKVINSCRDFLEINTSETILFCLKNENGKLNDEFEEKLLDFLSKNKTLWYLDNKIPLLSEVRGKIILFRRFSKKTSGSLGIDVSSGWKDNNSRFEINTENGTIIIQDYYEVKTNEEKIEYIEKMLDEAKSNNQSNCLYLNFASGYTKIIDTIPDIREVCNVVNPMIDDYLQKNPSGRYGVVLMDFIEQKTILQLINSNF